MPRPGRRHCRPGDTDVSVGAVRRQIGKGGDQLLPVFLTHKEIERVGDELEAYRGRLFKQRYLPHLKAFPKVRALFERLIADGKYWSRFVGRGRRVGGV